MTVRIEVTARDIAAGRPDEPDRCPVALAAVRAFRPLGFPRVEVILSHLCLCDPHGIAPDRVIEAPPSVVAFVEAFDASGPTAVAPFTFVVEFDPEAHPWYAAIPSLT